MSIDESPKLVSAAIKKLIEENEYIKHHKLNHDALLAVRKAAADVSKTFAEFSGLNMAECFVAIGESIDFLDNALFHSRMIEPKLTEYFTGDEIDEYNAEEFRSLANTSEERGLNYIRLRSLDGAYVDCRMGPLERVDFAKPGEDKSVNIAVVYCKECGHNHQVEIESNESGAIIIDNDEQVNKAIKRFHDSVMLKTFNPGTNCAKPVEIFEESSLLQKVWFD